MGENFKYAITYIVVMMFQMLVLDNVSIMGFGTPFLYLWLIICLPKNISPYVSLLVGFLTGAIIDLYSSTPGLHAFASTAAALCSVKLLPLFMTENDDISHTVFVPSMKTLRIARFVNYTLIIVVLHHVLLFSLEAFSFSSFGILVLRMVSSMVFTFVLIFAIEYFRFKKKDNI